MPTPAEKRKALIEALEEDGASVVLEIYEELKEDSACDILCSNHLPFLLPNYPNECFIATDITFVLLAAGLGLRNTLEILHVYNVDLCCDQAITFKPSPSTSSSRFFSKDSSETISSTDTVDADTACPEFVPSESSEVTYPLKEAVRCNQVACIEFLLNSAQVLRRCEEDELQKKMRELIALAKLVKAKQAENALNCWAIREGIRVKSVHHVRLK